MAWSFVILSDISEEARIFYSRHNKKYTPLRFRLFVKGSDVLIKREKNRYNRARSTIVLIVLCNTVYYAVLLMMND